VLPCRLPSVCERLQLTKQRKGCQQSVRALLPWSGDQLQRKLTLLDGLNANTSTASLHMRKLAVSGWGAGTSKHDW
jgi:hypothetical protein